MLFEHRYSGSSDVRQGDASTAMSFVPDALRPPTYFRGRITKQLEFREAISALHDVVTSDLRFVPKDRSSYMAWREAQSYLDLAQITADQKKLALEIKTLQGELSTLEAQGAARRRAFYDQRYKYFQYLYQRDRELWFKLDPVITVHPDQVFFECFSKDESSYGRLAASYEVFEELGDRANGTTNIDYSERLYGEFQKIRTYKQTTLEVDPSGFDVSTSMEDTYREVKIDLPETWVRGFLQVSSAATLPAHVVELHPMDVHNLCLILRRNKELVGPRSLRFQLTPGLPVKITIDPWKTELSCPRSTYTDSKPNSGDVEVRLWGRRRLHILERLLPRANKVRVFLLGTGLPSYWVVDLGHLSFTLGLSGWTLNNWSDAGNFDLMAAREDVDDLTRARVFAELGKTWLATPEELATRTGLATPIVASALAGWVQAGRAIFDLDKGVYRKRELTRDPLPMEKLRFSNERETAAAQLLHRGKIAIDRAESVDGGLRLEGRIKDEDNKLFAPQLVFDSEQRQVGGECTCDWFIRNRLHRGPCQHMLALRAAHRRGISDTIELPSAPPPPSIFRAPSRPSPADEETRENFAAAFRRGVTRAMELRREGRIADGVVELERIARLAPPDSVEHARLMEVIAEANLDMHAHRAAITAADRALAKLPDSALALRLKRDALIALDDVPSAIPTARDLCTVENTPERWSELIGLCEQIEDWVAMYRFADEGLARNANAVALVEARTRAKDRLGDVKIDTPPQPSWWKRAFRKITGRQTPLSPLETQVNAIADALALSARVIDRETLLSVLRVAHPQGADPAARATAIASALRRSYAIRDLPDDHALTALLQEHLS
jgi:hypothetical protein